MSDDQELYQKWAKHPAFARPEVPFSSAKPQYSTVRSNAQANAQEDRPKLKWAKQVMETANREPRQKNVSPLLQEWLDSQNIKL